MPEKPTVSPGPHTSPRGLHEPLRTVSGSSGKGIPTLEGARPGEGGRVHRCSPQSQEAPGMERRCHPWCIIHPRSECGRHHCLEMMKTQAQIQHLVDGKHPAANSQPVLFLLWSHSPPPPTSKQPPKLLCSHES